MDEFTRRHIQRRLDAWAKLRHIADRIEQFTDVQNTTGLDPEIRDLRNTVNELERLHYEETK